MAALKMTLCVVLACLALALAGIVSNGNHYANCRAADAVITNPNSCNGI